MSLSVTPFEHYLVDCIVNRALRMAEARGVGVNGPELKADLCAVHLSGCPLDFKMLLEADDFTFAHDVAGVRSHIDRTTGELHRFLPRCIRLESEDGDAPVYPPDDLIV